MTIWERLRAAPKVLRFGLVGGSAFVLCAGLMKLLVHLGVGPFWGQFATFPVGVLFTWQCNRRLTFAASGKSWPEELAQYLAASGVGLAVNVGVFSVLLWIGVPWFPALGLAAVAGMVANFLGYNRVVFSQR